MAFIGNTNTTQAFTPAIDYFSGNASTTAFTLSRPVASVAQVQVVVNNVAQNPSSAYTISSSTITFTSAPTSGTNNIYVYYTSPITQVIAPGQGTVTSDSFGTITNFTTTGNTTLGDATSDTLTVGVTGIVKDASGNVGIGTASPTSKLQVAGANINFASNENGILNVFSTDADATDKGGSISLGGNSNSGLLGFALIKGAKQSTDAGYLAFGTRSSSAYSTERMRIDSSGNLLVGLTSSTIAGDGGRVLIDGGSGLGLLANRTGDGNIVRWYRTNSQVGSINLTAGATAYNTSSDYRLKNTIAPMIGALAKVALLKPCTYKWNADGSDGQGFIAHELAEVVSGCVTGEKDAVETYTDEEGNEATRPAYQGIDTSFLVATLTAAIQEQQALITALTARITALENK